jgi:hypothetical protein
VSDLTRGKSRWLGITLGVAVGTVLAMALAGAVLATPGHSAAPHLAVVPTTGSIEQWAFGGNASYSYSCSTPTQCFGSSGSAGFSSASISLSYAITWAVIYTQTNVSSTQTTQEIQAGLGATASLQFSECYTDNSTPCQTVSFGVSLSGKEYGVAFTNVSSAGTVNLTAGAGSPGNVAADAIMNEASSELYNFSGNFNANIPAEDGNPAVSESANFDFGGNESSGINFPSALGLVPLNPQPGDAWSSNASYSAHGGFTAGATITYTVDSHSVTNSTWAAAAVTPSGQLYVNGSDLGAFTLYDNYTNPPTQVSAQIIQLNFSTGDEFTATDGWVLIPDGLFGDLTDLLLATPEGGLHPALAPSLGLGGLTTGETAYFETNKGFIGSGISSSSSSIPIGEGASTPNVHVTAGPEPVSVAQGQYSSILSGPSSSSGFPWTWLIVGVVVIILVAIVALMVVMRARRRGGAAMPPPMTGTMPAQGSSPGYPAPPQVPSPGYPTPPPGGPGNP